MKAGSSIWNKLTKAFTSSQGEIPSKSLNDYDLNWYISTRNKAVFNSQTLSNTPIVDLSGQKIKDSSMSVITDQYGLPGKKSTVSLYNNNGKLMSKDAVNIMRYKTKVAGQKAELTFHFFTYKLFLFTCTFPRFDASKQASVVKNLEELYKLPANSLVKGKCLIDTHHQAVFLTSEDELTITYLDLNSLFFAYVDRQLKGEVRHRA